MKSRLTSAMVLAAAMWAAPVMAAPILSTTTVLGGAALANFEGFAEGTIITNQYAGLTFGQVDGGTPMIDNSPFLFAFGASSGLGVLTGSTNGGAPFPTVAGLRVTFAQARSQVETFFSDLAPLGSYGIRAYGAGNVLLEQFTLMPAAIGNGTYVGFQRASADIFGFEVGPSSAAADAFSIDDLRASAVTAPVPEPATLALLGVALVGCARRRFARR